MPTEARGIGTIARRLIRKFRERRLINTHEWDVIADAVNGDHSEREERTAGEGQES
jgi:hypothetical protein